MILDLFFYLTMFISFTLWSNLLRKWLPEVNSLDSLSQSSAEALINQFMLLLIVVTILLVIVMLLLYSFFKGYIWKLILNKKFNIKYFLKFTLFNTIWFIGISIILTMLGFITKAINGQEFKPLMPIIALVSSMANSPYLTAVVLLLIMHITAIAQILFTLNPKLKTIKKSFNTFKKFHLFLIYYAFILIPLIVITLIGFFLRYAPGIVDSIISLILLIGFITWLRFYLIQILKNLKEL